MNIQIMIPDDAVRTMLATGNRLQGTISLANASEGNFHPHRRNLQQRDPERTVIMLRCGKAVATRDKLHLTLDVNREYVPSPVMTLQDDLKDAGEFFEGYDV